MKILRAAVLGVAMTVAVSCSSQEKLKGFDVGSCSPTSFAGGHVLVTDKDVSVDMASPAPHKIQKIEKPIVYKFVSEDKNGRHYSKVDEDGDKLEMVLDLKEHVGSFSVNGKTTAILLLIDDQDGSALDENTMTEFKACVGLLDELQAVPQPEQMNLDKS